MPTYLIAPDAFLRAVPVSLCWRARCIATEALHDARWQEVVTDLAEGASLIGIGVDVLARLRLLWVDSHPCQAESLRPAAPALLPLPQMEWRVSPCRGLFVRPPQAQVYFGSDEMPRMDVIPLLEALDAGSQPCAYPVLWLKHVAGSLVGRRFAGGNWFLFAFEEPLASLSTEEWGEVIAALCDRADSPLAITDWRTHYACYRSGETVLAHLRVANRSSALAAVRLELAAEGPDGEQQTRHSVRRCLNGREEVTIPWELPAGSQPGLWRLQATLYHEDRFLYGRRREQAARLVERSECGYLRAPEEVSWLPRPEIQGRSLRIGDQDGFLAGTHYYPSSSWFDWAWRDFRPEKAAVDVAQMERLGYRLARVWVDPELDEIALRGLEAWLYLSGMRGIVSIVCVFSQWVRHLSYPEDKGMTTFEFMGPADYNVYSVQLTHIEHQRRYLGTLARRWRHLPNLIWNLANETQVVDPDPAQVDDHWFGEVEPRRGPQGAAAYFNRWADLMTEAVRNAGAQQPILRGYGFVMAGDCYLQNRSGDLLTWHHYVEPEVAGPALAFAHPGLIAKPLLLEEFGISTFDEAERLARYEGVACWAAIMGAAGACSYEWGVSWLARELSYVPTPLKDASLQPHPDPRWYQGQLAYSQSWPVGSVGICPWAASFCFGSNYGGTPFPTPAAVALGEVAHFCAEIGPPTQREPVLLVVPSEWEDFVPHHGYPRVMDPTVKTVQALAAAHIPFSVVQEDQLGQLDRTPAAIIMPATQSLAPETRAHLQALAANGTLVQVGKVAEVPPALSCYALPLESDAPIWCLRRQTRRGHLYFLYAPNGQVNVRLRIGEASEMVTVPRYALLEVAEEGSTRVLVGKSAPLARVK